MAKNKYTSQEFCSFCGRGADEVKMLVAGNYGYICNECAQQANDYFKEQFALRSKASRDETVQTNGLFRLVSCGGQHTINHEGYQGKKQKNASTQAASPKAWPALI